MITITGESIKDILDQIYNGLTSDVKDIIHAPVVEPVKEKPVTEPVKEKPATKAKPKSKAVETVKEPEATAPVAEPVEEPAPAPEPVKEEPTPEPVKESETATEVQAVTPADARAWAVKVNDKVGSGALKAILLSFQAQKFSQLHEDDYPEFVALCVKRLEEKK